jgi:DNA/RNA-binding domain of Phe-tRNA-synthetase-like protein
MRYTVDPKVFKLQEDIKFGIIIGKHLTNTETTDEDESRLRRAEEQMRCTIQSDQLREVRNVALYRDVMTKAGINPNKYLVSVEAMFKRILKGGNLPKINALVDLCNAVSVEQVISLGGHDLDDITRDMEVRFSHPEDRFLPFGAEDYEPVDENELVFTSGNIVQTRKWVWRQSELGKMTLNSSNIVFQLVGFGDDPSFDNAMKSIEDLVIERFNGNFKSFVVDATNQSIEF